MSWWFRGIKGAVILVWKMIGLKIAWIERRSVSLRDKISPILKCDVRRWIMSKIDLILLKRSISNIWRRWIIESLGGWLRGMSFKVLWRIIWCIFDQKHALIQIRNTAFMMQFPVVPDCHHWAIFLQRRLLNSVH